MNDLGRCFPQIMKGQFLRVMLTIEENQRIKTITEVQITSRNLNTWYHNPFHIQLASILLAIKFIWSLIYYR